MSPETRVSSTSRLSLAAFGYVVVCSNKKWVDILVGLNCSRQRKGKTHVKLLEVEGLLIYQDRDVARCLLSSQKELTRVD